MSQETNPQPPEDSNIEVGPPPQRLRLDDLLSKAVAQAGYRRVAKLTYRAQWSAEDVEHILAFDTYGTPKIFLRGDAGLRNAGADRFVLQCQGRYASPIVLRCLRESRYVPPPWHCWLQFSIGDLFNWGVGGSLTTVDYTPEALEAAIAGPVRDKLVLYLGGITTIAKLLEFAERDEEPMRWFRVAGYIRAAIVAYLAAKLGVARQQTRDLLMKRAEYMTNSLDTARFTPESFIDHVLDDAEAEFSGGQAP
jgi:hypothetical protein